jgi:hypothetical protein
MSQFPQHRITNSDDVRTGNAVSSDRTKKGVPLTGEEAQSVVVLSLGAPAAAAANNVCLAQAIAGAANAVINGALASSGVATFDVPRAMQFVSSNAGDTTQTVTITGTDVYGAAMKERVTLNGTTIVQSKKAFKRVTQVAVSAVMAGNLTVGTNTVLGLPYRPVRGGFIRGRLGEDTADAGTYTTPERSASTLTTNDVRGTYTPAGALNGANVYTVVIAMLNGPNDSDAYGIAQFNA